LSEAPDPSDHPSDPDRSGPAGPEAGPLTLAASAALIGEYRWIEHALYRLLGQWVSDTPLAAVQLHLDAQSMRHSWHAELWGQRLPVLAGVDPDEVTRPSAPAAARFAALTGAGPTADGLSPSWPTDEDPPDRPGALPRLAGLYRVVLPRLVTGYQRHLDLAQAVTDGPVMRTLRLVLNDEIEDWRSGERLVQRLVSRPHDVAAVYEFLGRLESSVVGAGASSGLVPLPGTVPGD
jgi:hypothetical protein